jgi:hypothetical protein
VLNYLLTVMVMAAAGAGFVLWTYRLVRGTYRDVVKARAMRARRKAGLPETDHAVTLWEVPPTDPGDVPFLIAGCDEPGCDWDEWPPNRLAYGEQEPWLRAAAAKHGSAVAPRVRRPDLG